MTRRLFLIAAGSLALSAAPLHAQETHTRIGGYAVAQELPEVLRRVAPMYPEDAMRRRVYGRVLIQALIGTNGRVREAKVVESVPGLDEAAVESVRAWEFKPPYLEDRLQPVWVTLAVDFVLPGSSTEVDPNLPVFTERVIPTTGFRSRLAAAGDSAWAKSAALVALTLVGSDCECSNFGVDVQSPPERPDEAVVSVTHDGLLDDSIRSQRYRLRMRRDRTRRWMLETATIAYRCRPGRGHEEFTIEPCR
jgi:TonB family protein